MPFKFLRDRKPRPVEAVGKLYVGMGYSPPFNQSLEKQVDHDSVHLKIVSLERHRTFKNFDLILPMTIGETLFLSVKRKKQNFKKFIVPPHDVVLLADNKSKFNRFLMENGFGQYLPATGPDQDYPFVIKRDTDCGGQHTILIRDENDRRENQALFSDPSYFCQQYVDGETEYTTHFVYADGIRYSCSIEFRMKREHYIRGTQTQPFKDVEISVIPTKFESIFEEILAKLGFAGVGCFNFKIVDGKPIIFELNPRFGGSLPRDANNFIAAMMNELS